SSWMPSPWSVLLLGNGQVGLTRGGGAGPRVGVVAAGVGRHAVERRGGARAGDGHAARQREARHRGRARAVRTARVRAVVHEVRLFGRRRVADVSLRAGVEATRAV